jgi:predicted transcriptional regulator
METNTTETALVVTTNSSIINNEIAIYAGASLLKITPEEQEKLLVAFDEKMIELRPDGLIYLPQTFWRQRLNQSFGIGQWCLIVKNSFKDSNTEKDKLYVEGVLMARGCYIATAVGEAELHTDNPLQSWASVFESAKSDCITRCCKDLSIASELWQPQFIKRWLSENAVKVFVEKKDGKKAVSWRKKTDKPFWNERGIVPEERNADLIPPTKNGVSEPAKQSEIKPNPPGTAQDKKPEPANWLNKFADAKQTDFTKAYLNTVQKLRSGEITLQTVYDNYKVNKDLRAELEGLAKEIDKDRSK